VSAESTKGKTRFQQVSDAQSRRAATPWQPFLESPESTSPPVTPITHAFLMSLKGLLLASLVVVLVYLWPQASSTLRLLHRRALSSGARVMSSVVVSKMGSDQYKGQAGKIAVVGGSLEYTGAPYLAAMRYRPVVVAFCLFCVLTRPLVHCESEWTSVMFSALRKLQCPSRGRLTMLFVTPLMTHFVAQLFTRRDCAPFAAHGREQR
jgi:hypothetical protein